MSTTNGTENWGWEEWFVETTYAKYGVLHVTPIMRNNALARILLVQSSAGITQDAVKGAVDAYICGAAEFLKSKS